jgi:hypothetical protein
MANALYDKARQGFLDGSIDWDTDTIKAVLIDEALYTVDLANHEFLSSVPSGARVGTPQTLTSKTATNGVADAADITFPTVPLHDPVEAILIYKDTGVEGTSRLMAYINSATGLPVTPNGGDIAVQWDNGANKIFKL